jgi:hypothetical protein
VPDRTIDAAASEPQSPTPRTEVPAGAPAAAPPPADAPATEAPAAPAAEPPDATAQSAGPGSATPPSQMPEYKGEPLDAERGPGLGCFWIQVGLLTFFLVFTPLTVTWGWDPLISGALLIFTLILLLFTGQTIIFLLRLVAADRRARRTPLNPSAKPTIGQMEDAAPQATDEPEPDEDKRIDG